MSNSCERLRPILLEHADGSLPSNLRDQAARHLSDCADCRIFVQEMSLISRNIAGMPRKQTSTDFDARLATRLAEARRSAAVKPAWRRALEGVFLPRRPGLRPGLALCGVAAALGCAVYLTPQPIKPIAPSAGMDESAMLTQCIEQHRSDMSVQPLDDWSALNLSQQIDKAPAAAAPGAVSLAEESNF